VEELPMKQAENPFRFVTVSNLTRIGNQIAITLEEFRDGWKSAADASIFHHTFQSLGTHHFLQRVLDDFAQWGSFRAQLSHTRGAIGGSGLRDTWPLTTCAPTCSA